MRKIVKKDKNVTSTIALKAKCEVAIINSSSNASLQQQSLFRAVLHIFRQVHTLQRTLKVYNARKKIFCTVENCSRR